MTALGFLIVCIATAAVRLLHRLIDRPDVLSDSYPLEGDQGDVTTHLLAIDLIRRNGHVIPRETPQFLLATDFDYPAFFHKLMSYVPRSTLERRDYLVSPLFEGLHAGFVYLAAGWIANDLLAVAHAPWIAAWVTVTFAFAPVLTGHPRRGSVLGERCFGFLFGHVCLFALLVGRELDSNLWLAVALPAFWVVAVGSKFALQAIVFVALGYAAIRLDPAPVAFVVVGLASAGLVSGGYAWRVLSGTVWHSNFYRTFLVRIHDYTTSFSFRDVARGVALIFRGDVRDGVRSIRHHPIHRFLWLAPALIPALVVWSLETPRTGDATWDVVGPVLAGWGLSALCVAVLTTTDPLKFIGEGERYLEYAIFPTALSTALWALPDRTWLAAALPLFCFVYLVVAYRTAGPVSSGGPEARALRAWFVDRPPATILAIPGRLGHALCYGTDHALVWWFTNAPREPILGEWKAMFRGGSVYPFPAPAALKEAQERWAARFIVVDKDAIAGARKAWGLKYDFEGLSPCFENERFVVYDVARAGRGVKVCFVAPHAYALFYPEASDAIGGAEVRAHLLATRLAATGRHEVSFLLLDRGQPDRERRAGVDLVRQRGLGRVPGVGPRLVAHAAASFASWPFLGRSLDRARRRAGDEALARAAADVYCVFGASELAADVASFCRSRAEGRRYVLFASSDADFSSAYQPHAKGRNTYGSREDRCFRAVAEADAIVVQTEQQAGLLRSRFAREATVVPNPIDLAATDKECAPVSGAFVLWVGKADSVKRPEVLIELARQLSDVPFVMVLNASDPRVRDVVRRDAPDNVRIVDSVPFAEIDAWFRGATALVNTSRFEGFPNTFLQAWKNDIPVISQVVDPDGVLSKEGCGIVAGEDVEALARAVRRVRENEAERRAIARRAGARLGEHHDAEKVAARVESVLEAIRAGRL